MKSSSVPQVFIAEKAKRPRLSPVCLRDGVSPSCRIASSLTQCGQPSTRPSCRYAAKTR